MIRRLIPAILLAILTCFCTNLHAQKAGTFDGREKLTGYPEVTYLIEVKDARKASAIITKNGGKIVYDPNLGVGHDIPFLVVTLPGEKVVDEKFIKSLELVSGSSTFHAKCDCDQQPEQKLEPLSFDTLFVPVEDINLPKLQKRSKGKASGKGIKVAVIDTGVDASHPVFQDRVIYWHDATQEGRVKLEKLKVIEGQVTFNNKTLTVPKRIAGNKEVFVGVVDETAMGIQFADALKTLGRAGLDFNRNKSIKDKFVVMIGVDAAAAEPAKTEPAKAEAKPAKDDKQEPKKADEKKPAEKKEDKKEKKKADGKKPAANADAKEKPAAKKPAKPALLAFFDVDGDGAIKGKEAETPILDFNVARKIKRDGGELKFAEMVVFPSRTKTIAYPLLFRADAKGNVPHVTIGAAMRSHGTHVAGIIAGNGEQIVGAAPEAEIMSIKTCSGFSCTEAAIIRGLLMAFFNPEGYVPDVVNISLGSSERYNKDRTDILIQDLSAKFGTVFCVSASNSGTGYRSINHIGSLSPAILVGAHVSRQTLARHYRLQEGVDVPEHVLLQFTSLGPSYTGQLRPNIVAPGSALSATSLIDDGSSMYNGTSMSSPITAGAVAAMLSLAKEDPAYAKLEAMRQKKIQAVLKKTDDAKYSLTSIPLAIRTAMEDSAVELPDYTMPQQGHGLLDIDGAYEELIKLAAKLNEGTRLVEFKINGNDENRRLYDRSNNIPPVKRVFLSLDTDGELSEANWLKLRNAATTVKLARVQIQNIDGTVQNLDKAAKNQPLPFSVGVPGKEGEPGREIVLVMSNSFKGSFYSVRRLEMMEAGKTYIAHYDVSQNGQRLMTMLDVVHKPIELSDLKTEVNLPGIDVNESNRAACYINQNQPLKASAFHRYPVAVTERDSALNIELGFGKDQSGLVMVQVYDPDGYAAGLRVIKKSPQLDSEIRTTKLVVNTLEKRGIWEVTVSSFSGTWLGESAYDLLIEAYRFVPSVKSLSLGSKAAPTPAPGSERIVSLMNSSRQVSSVSVLWGKTERITPLKPFGIAPNHRTYKKLPLPTWDAKQGGSKNTTVVLEIDRLSKINEQIRARIDHRLYKKGADGKFVAAYKADLRGSASGRKTFRNVPRPEAGRASDTLYAAVETVNVYSEGKSLSQVIDHVDMLVAYPDIAVKFKETLHGAYLASDSTADVKLLKVTAPAEVIDETTRPTSRSSQATLKVETGDANLPELEIKLPITLNEKRKAPPGYRVQQRARATLQIKTNHANISASIPVRISQ